MVAMLDKLGSGGCLQCLWMYTNVLGPRWPIKCLVFQGESIVLDLCVSVALVIPTMLVDAVHVELLVTNFHC